MAKKPTEEAAAKSAESKKAVTPKKTTAKKTTKKEVAPKVEDTEATPVAEEATPVI